MNKTISSLLVVSLLFINSLFSQQYTEGDTQSSSNFSTTIEDYLVVSKQVNQSFKGSIFENDDFFSGSLFSDDQILVQNIFLRYNVFQDEFQFKQTSIVSDDNIQSIKKMPGLFIKVQDQIFTYKISLDNSFRSGYYNILAEGDSVDLYKKYGKKIIEGSKSITKMTADQASRMINDNSLYVVDSNGNFIELAKSSNRRLKTIIEASNSTGLKQYVKTNRLKLNKEEDLIKAIEFVNSQS